MASGISRKHQVTFGLSRGCAIVLSVLMMSSLAWGQGGAPAAPAQASPPQASPPQASPPQARPSQVMPAPFSQDCQIGGTAIVEESALPNVAAALQTRKQVKILTIGASPSLARRSARGQHNVQVGQILEQAIKGLDVVTINRGVSGELSAQAAGRIKNLVALNEPDLVLWQVGTNDALAYVPLDELETTILDTVRWLKSHKVDVVLVGLQYVDRMTQDEHYGKVRELLRAIAAKENVMIVRRYEAQRLLAQAEGSGGGLVPDEFQRSELGYACLSQYLARAITLGVFGQRLRVRPLTNPPVQPRQ
jgi:lysophospholipase L1-like esterase